MKLSNTTEYALRILIYMAKEPAKLHSAKHLIDELKISDKYLRRIMTDLSKAGFIQSVQGRDGGYTFTRGIDEIYLSEIINSVEGADTMNGCVLGFEACSCTNPCAMHHVWVDVRTKQNKVFNETRLADMDYTQIVKF